MRQTCYLHCRARRKYVQESLRPPTWRIFVAASWLYLSFIGPMVCSLKCTVYTPSLCEDFVSQTPSAPALPHSSPLFPTRASFSSMTPVAVSRITVAPLFTLLKNLAVVEHTRLSAQQGLRIPHGMARKGQFPKCGRWVKTRSVQGQGLWRCPLHQRNWARRV